MLDWHQREDRPRWWEHFHRLSLSEEELIDDTTAIGGLRYLGRNADQLHEFSFPAGQEHKLAPETKVVNPETAKSAGSVVRVDDGAGRLWIRFSRDFDEPPTALVPSQTVSTQVLRDAIGRLVDTVLNGETLAPYEAGIRLLQCPSTSGDSLR